MIKWIKTKYQRIVHPPSLEDAIAESLKVAEIEIMQCDYTIRMQSFMKHMAIARQNAMLEWVRNEKRG